MISKSLTGHVSPETAFVVADYPYGFRLRCQIRYWLEFKKGFGYRLVSQTSNPKKPVLVWNKPKAGTYHALAVLCLDEIGHVCLDTLRPGWDDENTIAAFERMHDLDETGLKAVLYCRAMLRANARITCTITPQQPGEVPQTREEQSAILNAALRAGYAEVLSAK